MQCPYCANVATVKRGLRKTRNGPAQLYYCKKCRKRFSLASLPSYTYRADVILSAPVYYFLGYTLRGIQARIMARFKQKPSLAMISHWIKKFGKYSPLKSQRDKIQAFALPQRIIRRKLIRHAQTYLFQVNVYKLSLLSGENGLKLRNYLEGIMAGNDSVESDQFGLRASSFPLELSINVQTKKSYACDIADIAVKAALANHQRHAMVQKFLLATDGATVAVEVPIFLTRDETKGILGKDDGLLGHIDFIQVFGNTVYILDYKPEADRERNVLSQLFLYALALSRRSGIHLKHIACAWFDEKSLFSFPAMDAYAAFKKIN